MKGGGRAGLLSPPALGRRAPFGLTCTPALHRPRPMEVERQKTKGLWPRTRFRRTEVPLASEQLTSGAPATLQ